MNSRLTDSPQSGRLLTVLLLVLICLVVVGHHLVYLNFDLRGFTDHDLYFTSDFFKIDRMLAGNEPGVDGLTDLLFYRYSYPYLVNLLLAAVTRFTEMNFFLFKALNLVFYLSLVLGVYALGLRRGGRAVGLLCALSVATLPIFDEFSRKYFFQFHACAVLIWAHWLALRSGERPGGPTAGDSALLGAVLGLAALIHPIALPLCLPPVILFFWSVVRSSGSGGGKILRLGIAAAFTLLLAGTWYLPNAAIYLGGKGRYVVADAGVLTGDLFVQRIVWWARRIFWDFPGPVWTAVFFVGLLAWFRNIFSDDKGTSPYYYPLTIIYYLGLSLFLFLNQVFSHDVMILFALIPPFLLGELNRALIGKGFLQGWKRVAIFVLLLLLATAALTDKFSAPAKDCLVRENASKDSGIFCQHNYRTLWAEPEPLRALLEEIKGSAGPAGTDWRVKQISFDGDAVVLVEPPAALRSTILTQLQATGAMVGLKESEAPKRSFELLYYLLDHDDFLDEKFLDRAALRQVVEKYLSGSDRRLWFRIGRPYDPFAHPGLVLLIIREVPLS